MKNVLTSEQMREADRRTIAAGTPGDVLMERAGTQVVEVLEREFAPLASQRVVIFCGKGNNGGDGLVVARLLEDRVASLQVMRVEQSRDQRERSDPGATIVVDALLGTGFRGEVQGDYAELIRSINEDFPKAKIVAVDIPSAMKVRANITVTFAAPKVDLVMDSEHVGKMIVADIGIREEFLQSDLHLSEAHDFAVLFKPRKRDSNKGMYGHVLVIGGSPGKSGAAAMSGLAALRAGAGLVSVACADPSKLVPELMTESLDNFSLEKKTVLAVGPGLGPAPDLLKKLMSEVNVPMIIDADGLNSIAGTDFHGRGLETILTPHPGEMARLVGGKFTDRLTTARTFARDRNVCLVLKGQGTLIALPDGQVWVNPTGSPSMAKGGTGDILTGMVSGMVAQHPDDIATAVRAAVWLHGRAGELGAEEWTDKCLLATELLNYLPTAMRECANPFPDGRGSVGR
jgi:ADP-dependent NAD(P)H-hydrate dehydratase / NAD(P)H-hydrate epimerase